MAQVNGAVIPEHQALRELSKQKEAFAKGRLAYPQPDMGSGPATAAVHGENTFIGFGINVIDGKDFIDAVTTPLLCDEVYGDAQVDSVIDSSNYTKGEYTATVRKELSDMFNSLNVSCKVETGKAVPFFSGGVEAMYGAKRQVKSESQFYRIIYAVTTKKHTLKGAYLFAGTLRSKLAPLIQEILDSPDCSPDDIFSLLGTHVILSHSLGGDVNVTGIYNSNENTTSHEVEAALTAACAYVKAEAKTSLSESDKKIGSETEIRIAASGGDVSAIGGASFETLGTVMKDWAKTVTDPKTQTLSFIYQYMPIWELTTVPERKKALADRFWKIAAERGGALSGDFTRATRPAPPAPVSPVVPGVKYIFKNRHADYCMDIFRGEAKHQQAQLWEYNGSPTQQFDIIMAPGSTTSFCIRLPHTNMVLDVYENRAYPGAVIWQYERNGGEAQYFTLRINNDGTVSFLFSRDQQYAIDTDSNEHKNGTKLVLKAANGNNTQKWLPIKC